MWWHDTKEKLRMNVQIKVVALEEGYRQQRNFSSHFKVSCGMSPTLWLARQVSSQE